MGICRSREVEQEADSVDTKDDVADQRTARQKKLNMREVDYTYQFPDALPQTNEFYKYVCENDVKQVQRLLSLGENPNHTYAIMLEGGSMGACEQSSKTALCVACQRGYTEIVRLLLDAKSDPQKTSSWGGDNRMSGGEHTTSPPLADAVKACGREGSFDIVQQLLDAKVDPRLAICRHRVDNYNWSGDISTCVLDFKISPTLKNLLFSVLPPQVRDYARVLLQASSSAKQPEKKAQAGEKHHNTDIPLQLLFHFFQGHPGLIRYVGGIMLGFVPPL